MAILTFSCVTLKDMFLSTSHIARQNEKEEVECAGKAIAGDGKLEREKGDEAGVPVP